MKRLIILMLVVIFALSVAGFAASKAPAKAKPVSDQLLIKKAVLVYDDARAKNKVSTSLSKVKFGPIKIVSGWATTTYININDKGKVVPDNQADYTYILKKVKEKWQVAMKSDIAAIDIDQCKKIGLPFSTAKKLDVVQFWD